MKNNTLEFYPYKSIDLLLPKNIDFSEYEGEWDVYFEYNKKIKSAECANKSFFKDIAKKLNFVFLNINKDNVWPDENGNRIDRSERHWHFEAYNLSCQR